MKESGMSFCIMLKLFPQVLTFKQDSVYWLTGIWINFHFIRGWIPVIGRLSQERRPQQLLEDSLFLLFFG